MPKGAPYTRHEHLRGRRNHPVLFL